MSWQFSLATDIGGRTEQQDCLDRLSLNGGDSHLVIVADGMGGHRDGALHSPAFRDDMPKSPWRRMTSVPPGHRRLTED